MSSNIPIQQLQDIDTCLTNIHCDQFTVPQPFLQKSPHRHNYHEVLIILQGEGINEVNHEREFFVAPSVLLISRGEVHDLQPQTAIQGWALCLDEGIYADSISPEEQEFLDVLFHFKKHSNYGLDAIAQQTVTSTLTLLRQELKVQGHRHSLLGIRHLLNYFFLTLVRINRANTDFGGTSSINNSIEQVTRKFMQIAANSFSTDITIQEIAQRIDVSPSQLHICVKKISGKTPKEILNQFRITEIKKSLIYSSESIEQIARRLSLSEASYLARFFKKNTGMTPSEFRLQWREKS